jgi:hypothetical protein
MRCVWKFFFTTANIFKPILNYEQKSAMYFMSDPINSVCSNNFWTNEMLIMKRTWKVKPYVATVETCLSLYLHKFQTWDGYFQEIVYHLDSWNASNFFFFQAMMQMMNVDSVMSRLTSILYEASLPRDPNHYKTGFWGRAQVWY